MPGPARSETEAAGGASGPGRPGRRGAGLYFGASLLSQAAGLLRYVVLARFLGPHQLGLAAALTVTGSFFELVSDTGSDRFLIQDRDGDLPPVQHLVQLVYVCRGLAVSLLLAIGSVPIAYLYGTPSLAGGLALLALSPLVGGFLHLDIRRAQRGHDFRAEAICNAAADTAGLAGAVAGAWVTRDFTAAAYGFIARSTVLVIGSHLLARRPYRLGWDKAHAPRLARFAAPLMLNGLTLFVVSQGDRVVIGNQLGVTSLGYYTAILLLISYPSNVLGNYIHALFIPKIAALRDKPAERNLVGDQLGSLTFLLALAMASGFVLVAPLAVPILYGTRFAQSAELIGLIGVLQASRFLLTWPTTVALAMGRSTTVLLSNLCHFAIVPGALLGLRLIGGLGGVTVGFLAAEMGAIAVALMLLNRATSEPRWTGFDRLAILLVAGSAIVSLGAAIDSGRWLVPLMLLLMLLATMIWQGRSEIRFVSTHLTRFRGLAEALGRAIGISGA